MLKDDRFHFGLSVQALFQRTFLTVTVCFPLVVSGAVKTWDGSTSGYWGTGANWTDGVAPSDGDDLVFPAGAAHLLNTNNILRLKVGSITFSGSNYIIRGLPIGLANGIAGKQASGGNTLELDVTLQADQTFDCRVAGAGQTLSGNITNAGYVLTIAGSGDTLLSGVISGAGGLTKNGSGTCRLAGSAANTYTGTTTVNAGTLELNKTAGVAVPGRLVIGDGSGTDMVRELAHYQIGFVSVTVNSSGRLDLNGFNDSIGPLTLSGGTVTTGTGTLTLGGDLTVEASAVQASISGNLSLGGATRTIDVADSALNPEIVISAIISDGGIYKTGQGNVTFSGANTYAGLTTIADGFILLQNASGLGSAAAGTVLTNQGDLSLVGVVVSGETLTNNSSNSILQASGSAGWTSNIVLNADLHVQVLSGTLDLAGVISGAGGLTKSQAGTLRLSGSGANSYTGDTIVNAGVLELNKVPTDGAIPYGRLIIGDGLGGEGADVVRELRHFQIEQIPIIINSSGLLDLNGFDDTVGPLMFNGGHIVTGTGTLYMMGDATVNTNADSRALITGIVSLPATRTIDVADSPEFLEDLTIAAEVRGLGGLIKTGPGRLYLTTSNSFSGPVTVQTGCLWVQNSFGLGATNSGTVVQAGANLSIQNGLCIIGEALTLNGDGEACGAGAALFASVGSNVWTGPVTLASDSWIAVDATGLLNLSGPIGGPGGLRYWGSPMAGSLILSGSAANTYGGTTYVIHGTLVLNKAVANGAIPGDLIIGDGLGGTNADVVRAIGGAQIGNSGNVVVNSSGLLDLSAMTWEETLGSLAGSGNVALGSNHLSVNINNASTVFSGVISGSGGRLTKLGTGTLTLVGNNTYSGSTTVGDGTLLVNGSQPASAVTLSSSTGKLGGSGTVGGVTANGIVVPGASPGVLTVNGNLAFSASGKFGVELNGASPGTGYDQLNVVGTVSLGNAALQATLGFVSPGNTSFTIINNDAADAVVGTFAGLPQGAILHISGTPFRISYTGGDGNDVVLTQLADTQQPLLQIAPTGGTHVVLWWPTNFSDYKLVSNTNLESGEWSIVSTPPVVIGTNYHVTNQATRPQLYYRLQFP